MIYLIQYLELINLILHSFMSWSLYAFYYNQYFYSLLNFCLSYKGKKWKIKSCPYTYFHNKDVRFVQKNCRWYIEKRFFLLQIPKRSYCVIPLPRSVRKEGTKTCFLSKLYLLFNHSVYRIPSIDSRIHFVASVSLSQANKTALFTHLFIFS